MINFINVKFEKVNDIEIEVAFSKNGKEVLTSNTVAVLRLFDHIVKTGCCKDCSSTYLFNGDNYRTKERKIIESELYMFLRLAHMEDIFDRGAVDIKIDYDLNVKQTALRLNKMEYEKEIKKIREHLHIMESKLESISNELKQLTEELDS